MPIYPLPQFEADVEELRKEREAYERLSAPKSIVVRFGTMKLIGEYPYSGAAKPGCGSKLVCRTHRGVELTEMLTSTCPNAGCSKSVSRQEILQFIENSGGRQYPFFTEGKVLRVATVEDLNEQTRLEQAAPAMARFARAHATELNLAMKVVSAEPILGGDLLTFYFTSEDRVDFRELVRALAQEYGTRIEMRQIGARDEARVTADYERCGQHCCCKQFLKVLKPVPMKQAKVQKATLDPLKISGRCGRLMCCLRYEENSYNDLEKRLPKMRARVGTPEGPGTVVDRQILTQLVLVVLEHEPRRIAVAVEDLIPPEESMQKIVKAPDPMRGMSQQKLERRLGRPASGGTGTSTPDSTPGSLAPGTPAPESPPGTSGSDAERRQMRFRDRPGQVGDAPTGSLDDAGDAPGHANAGTQPDDGPSAGAGPSGPRDRRGQDRQRARDQRGQPARDGRGQPAREGRGRGDRPGQPARGQQPSRDDRRDRRDGARDQDRRGPQQRPARAPSAEPSDTPAPASDEPLIAPLGNPAADASDFTGASDQPRKKRRRRRRRKGGGQAGPPGSPGNPGAPGSNTPGPSDSKSSSSADHSSSDDDGGDDGEE